MDWKVNKQYELSPPMHGTWNENNLPVFDSKFKRKLPSITKDT